MEPLLANAKSIYSNGLKNHLILNNVGANLESSINAIELAKKYSNMFAVIGIHPEDTKGLNLIEIKQKLENLIVKNKKYIVGIGETGLDYHSEGFDKNTQTLFFIEHIKLAYAHHLPLVVHIRDAYEDAYQILRKNLKPNQKVVVHCFSGNAEQLRQFLSLGCMISYTGVISFKNAEQLRQIVKLTPLNRIMAETDAP